ncbi:hypothetical protein Tco_1515971 [Tanacetum coccineum]
MKIPIIRKGEYDIWSMRMRQYICHTDHNLWDVIVNGDLEEEPAPTGVNLIALIMRNKPDIDKTDIGDLYNNLRVYEDELKRSSVPTLLLRIWLFSPLRTLALTLPCTTKIQFYLKNEDFQVGWMEMTWRNIIFEGGGSWLTVSIECYNCPEKIGHLLENARSGRNQEEEDVMVTMAGSRCTTIDLHHMHCGSRWSRMAMTGAMILVERNFLTPRADISFARLDEYAIRNKIIESQTMSLNTKKVRLHVNNALKCLSLDSDSVVSNPRLTGIRVITGIGTSRCLRKKSMKTKDLKQDVRKLLGFKYDTAGTRALVNMCSKSVDHSCSEGGVMLIPKGFQDYAVVDSGYSSHMTGNKAYHSDYEDFNRGFVAFENELIFKLLDESQVVLRAPRKDDVYSLDLKNIGKSPSISFMRPFGCPLTILNTLDSLGKFDGKSDEGYLLGYSTSSKAFRVYNKRIKRVEYNMCHTPPRRKRKARPERILT